MRRRERKRVTETDRDRYRQAERERERERERQTDTDRQTDRQTDGLTAKGGHTLTAVHLVFFCDVVIVQTWTVVLPVTHPLRHDTRAVVTPELTVSAIRYRKICNTKIRERERERERDRQTDRQTENTLAP